MSASKFTPIGDLVAIKKSQPQQPKNGLIYTPIENKVLGKGRVAAIGPGEVNQKGWVHPIDFKIGDYVVYDKRVGYTEFGGFLLIKAQAIVAQVEEDTDIQ